MKKTADAFMDGWGDEVEFVDLSAKDFDCSTTSIAKEDSVLIAMPCFGGRVPSAAVERLK